MAIPSGSGTEVIKSTEITALTNSVQTLITGVANHIYTVLSIIVCEANDDSGKMVKLYFADSDGSTNPVFLLRGQPVGANETFVFNDKFSYTGIDIIVDPKIPDALNKMYGINVFSQELGQVTASLR